MLHDGEGAIDNPDGTSTIVPQNQLQRIEPTVPGMATGGTVIPPNPLTPQVGANLGYQENLDVLHGGSKAVAAAAQGARQSQVGTNTRAEGVTAQTLAVDPYMTTGAKNAAMERTAIAGEGAMSTLNQQINTQDLTARENAANNLVTQAPTVQGVNATAQADFAAWAQTHTGQDWTQDPSAIAKGKSLYQVSGGDPNSPEFNTWMNNQWTTAGKQTNAITSAVNTMQHSSIYGTLPNGQPRPEIGRAHV
jgi:hypothetical protein